MERNSRLNADGSARIQLVLVKGKRARHYFGLTVLPQHWDSRKARVKNGAPHSLIKNDRIEQEIKRAQGLAILHPEHSPAELLKLLRVPANAGGVPLEVAFRKVLKEHGHRWKVGTRLTIETMMNDLGRFIPEATLQGLSVADVMRLDAAYVEKGLMKNTRRNRLGKLRAMYNRACKDTGLAAKDLFSGLIPSAVKGIKRFAPLDQQELLRGYAFPTFQMQLHVDSWLLQMDLGALRFGEVCRLDYDMEQEGAFRWVDNADKVPKPRYHPIGPKARAIMDKYKGGSHVLPLIPEGLSEAEQYTAIKRAGEAVNRSLKLACELLGIPRIKTHNARHTGAKKIKESTQDMHAARMILGHATVRQTEDYMDDLDTSVIDEVMKKVGG